MNDDERWLPIPGWEGHYEVSDRGRVKRVFQSVKGPKAGRIRVGILHRNGYLELALQRDGVSTQFGVHRLVAMAFHGLPQPHMQARHLDGNPTNNSAANLRWGTTSENTLDQVTHGTHRHSRRSHCGNGHELAGPNLVVKRDGSRTCRTCKNQKQNEAAARRRAGKEM